VATRDVEGRPRVTCPACETVFYENPLPVAASIVLNRRREVLLVKRKHDPHQGKWCLPMGFAETGETIAAAALRELREETGIEARVVRLLDADSSESSHYGDLLIVTFEMERVRGQEQAGDDAEEVRYFPIDQHPALAFSSNNKALRTCAAAHEEDWAIQDSFRSLQSNDDSAMLSDELIALIHDRADEVAGLWLIDVRTNATTASYQMIDPDQLMERATGAISQFSRWLKGDATPNEIRAFYRMVAKEREAQGLRLHELLSAVTLLKKHVWTFARAQGTWDRPVDAYRMLELSRRISIFFDKAMYHAAREFTTDRPA
jgi:ADP-ribose pyrophosphatase YjhB (NUDIX family)